MDNKANDHKYPNAFRFGFAYGIFLQFMTRMATKEPLSARPFSYLTVGTICGISISYYDWWRRTATEEILYSESITNYHNMVRAMNNVRAGEENET